MAKMDIQIDDHTQKVLLSVRKQIQLGLASVGQEAEKFAKKECPVDGGRLRNSIAWACKTKKGSRSFNGGNKDSRAKNPPKPSDSEPMGVPEENELYIGTNVEYAVYVEYCDYEHKTGKKHFLRDAIANHGDRYQEIMQAALDALE